MFTKGEAEAKALALRAEAYRQFNEAAIIQTVLSMLPEIVRAAAEPMANIEHLTVLSTDGASDVVRNVTRTVTEASATVKGLTGHRHPGAAQPGRRWLRPRSETPSGGRGEPSRGGGRLRRRQGRRPTPVERWRRSDLGGPAPASASAPTPGARRPSPPGVHARRPCRAAACVEPGVDRVRGRHRPAPPQFDGPGGRRRGPRRRRRGDPQGDRDRVGRREGTDRHGGRTGPTRPARRWRRPAWTPRA